MIIRKNNEVPVNLPSQTIIAEVLEPAIASTLFDVLATCVSKELEIYRSQPHVHFDGNKKPAVAMDTFDPRDNRTCFMGQKFMNDDAESYVLHLYRKAVGTIVHPIWGNATLLEIWGADHFKDHPAMVKKAFEYGYGISKVKPVIKFFVNPLFQNEQTGINNRAEEAAEYKKEMEELLARAVVFGVRTAAEARKSRHSRSNDEDEDDD